MRKPTSTEKELAVFMWDEIIKGMSSRRDFACHINWFQAEFLHIMGDIKWEHDELACELCGGQCNDCPLAAAGHGCHDGSNSWWNGVMWKWSVEDAKKIRDFYQQMEVQDAE